MASVVKLTLVSLMLAISPCVFADAPAHVIDLRAPQALEELQRSKPAQYAKIREILEGLTEQPKRAETDWLQVTFNARDVDLSRYLIKTSYPPKQTLHFTLDDSRYIVNVVRSDLTAELEPAKKR